MEIRRILAGAGLLEQALQNTPDPGGRPAAATAPTTGGRGVIVRR